MSGKDMEVKSEEIVLPSNADKVASQVDTDMMEQLSGDNDRKEAGDEKVTGEETSESPVLLLSRKSSDQALCLEFLEDQGREDNFTDLDLICSDGYIQVHRCLLMGASKFLRDLLIEKDIMDTTAITLPDTSVRHLTQVLALLYTGRTVIDGGDDEVKIYETMNMLGFPVTELVFRNAKVNDRDQVTVLRHNVSDDSGTCSGGEGIGEVGDEEERVEQNLEEDGNQESESVDDNAESGSMISTVTVEIDKNGVELEAKEDKLELYRGPTTYDANCGLDEDHLPQITSTTGDSESVNSFAPASKEKNLKDDRPLEELKSNGNQYKINSDNQILGLLELDDNQTATNPMSDDDDDEGSGKDVIINEESDRNSDVDSLIDEQSQSNIASQHSMSVLSDFEDMNFEEACNDLQKQVAKPLKSTSSGGSVSDGGGGDRYDMMLRKRKIDDNQPISEEDKPKMKTRSGGGARGGTVAKKKKSTPTKTPPKRKKGAPNGTSDQTEPGKSPSDKSRAKSPDRESVSSIKTRSSDSPSQGGRLSTCSGVTEEPLTRIFLDVKEVAGVKYNIYGFAHPANGVQTGKTIAIMASKDKAKCTSSSLNSK